MPRALAALCVLSGSLCLHAPLSSAWSPLFTPTAAGVAQRGSVFGFARESGPRCAAWRRRAVTTAQGVRGAECLNNESRRPKKDERFCLPHSPFEGRFLPINEQMTFQAEMEVRTLQHLAVCCIVYIYTYTCEHINIDIFICICIYICIYIYTYIYIYIYIYIYVIYVYIYVYVYVYM